MEKVLANHVFMKKGKRTIERKWQIKEKNRCFVMNKGEAFKQALQEFCLNEKMFEPKDRTSEAYTKMVMRLSGVNDQEFDQIIEDTKKIMVAEEIRENKGKGLLVDGDDKNQIIRDSVEYRFLPKWFRL